MGSEWITTTIGEFCPLSYGKALPERARNSAGRVPVYGSNGIVGYHDKALTDGPTIIIGRKGTVGAVHFSPKPCWPIDTTFFVTSKDTQKLRFKYYLLKSLGLDRMNADSAVPGLNRDAAHACKVRVPPFPEQRAIAHILGTLDDKIELNRRMNETLEAMARALFKSWFVDFDPVIDNALAAGNPIPEALAEKAKRRLALGDKRKPLPEHIRCLFPDRFVDSELGPIPEGWRVGTLGDVAEHVRRGIQPNEILPGTPYIALEHMPKRCIALSEWEVADGVESNKFEFKRGEILFGKLRPYFHKVGVAPVDGVCSTDIIVAKPRYENWFGFVLGHVSSVEFVEYTTMVSTGTKMPRTSWRDMARYEVPLPPDHVAAAFTRLIRPGINRIIKGIHESRALAALRDALLPKLISGEIRVRDAEKFVKEAI
ncbi:MAG: restriction endonuclease subunit S [Candidatus Thorarchaeota archaeon]|nr:MAG: restriction endonuclease subunit S [Candidatus Thorarchaeota archaeon]